MSNRHQVCTSSRGRNDDVWKGEQCGCHFQSGPVKACDGCSYGVAGGWRGPARQRDIHADVGKDIGLRLEGVRLCRFKRLECPSYMDRDRSK